MMTLGPWKRVLIEASIYCPICMYVLYVHAVHVDTEDMFIVHLSSNPDQAKLHLA